MKHGKGVFYYANGSRYEGEFRNDDQNGFGTYFYTDSSKYEGEWKDDKKDGQGIFYFPNGDKYVGDWKDNHKYGHGIIYRAPYWPEDGPIEYFFNAIERGLQDKFFEINNIQDLEVKMLDIVASFHDFIPFFENVGFY